MDGERRHTTQALLVIDMQVGTPIARRGARVRVLKVQPCHAE